MAFGRIALMGDAAFVARPHVGMGVTKAAEDAMALVQAIAQHGATAIALTAFEQARLSASLAVVQRGRRLGAHLHGDVAPNVQTPHPDKVMADTAIDLSG
jgi:2-polyprenyl-6-methoxyphenol hydroxylase-like FAD-dependent oxidoreductase